MAKRKKSRKVGLIGVRSVPKEERRVTPSSSKPKKKTGRPAGSRHSAAQGSDNSSSQGAHRDKRLGSKKPIPLIVEQPSEKKQKFHSPAQELAHIENDTRLAALLDKLDNDEHLSQEQQTYVDARLARHKVLCDLMGIDPAVEEDDEIEVDTDPFAQLDSSDLDAFRKD